MTPGTADASPQPLLRELLDPVHRADPYPLYDAVRAHGPLLLPDHNLAVFSSYADCDEVLRHPAACSDRLKSTVAQRAIADGAQARPFGPPGFLFLDPPDHTRLRRLVSKAFVPKVVRALEPDIVRIVDELLDAAQGTFDAIGGLAHPLPVAVICRLLGVPVEDEPRFRDASALLAQGLDPFVSITGAAGDGFAERLRAGQWLREYLRGLVADRRRDPGEDLMSALVAVEEAGDVLTEDEIVATCNLLLIAGHETTVNLIANATLALLRHPDQWAALGRDPSRAAAVIEETLRYDPPVQLIGRVAGEDMTIGAGVHIPRGDNILLLLAAAHRDPAATERPDEFDPDRATIRHLGFGKGPHFCIGAPLARLEATAALTALTARFPGARLAAEPAYKPNVTLRGMEELSITL
ncbi:cytochrome P450 [Mycolicibacterium sp. 018/SC-01/001]|uniref:cytochrome P450 n=1 Tax=Mycolicibacterium sp. 018/SC-01/001 TaxID=2592069 RepID=UPI00117ED28F|nr:cytochrome P450 [Mycolicibacterium sp. 018/SC-01/001]TRW88819.1 cytochrome P450 [Mycolicibacterium sp. 018/SC-01/001]